MDKREKEVVSMALNWRYLIISLLAITSFLFYFVVTTTGVSAHLMTKPIILLLGVIVTFMCFLSEWKWSLIKIDPFVGITNFLWLITVAITTYGIITGAYLTQILLMVVIIFLWTMSVCHHTVDECR